MRACRRLTGKPHSVHSPVVFSVKFDVQQSKRSCVKIHERPRSQTEGVKAHSLIFLH